MMWPAADFHGFISPFNRTRNTLFPDLITRWSLPRLFLGSCLLHFLIPTFQQSSFFLKISCLLELGFLFHYFGFFFSHNKNTKRDFLVFLNHTLSETTQFLPILVFSLSKYNTDSNIRSIRYHRSNYINVKF